MFDRGVTTFTTSPPTVSIHNLLKLKSHKQRILKLGVTVFHYSTEEWICVWDKWAVFYKTCSKCPSCYEFPLQSSRKKFGIPTVFDLQSSPCFT